jgi:hypothetical protein
MENLNEKKLNKIEGKEKYHVEFSNRFAALEDFDTEVGKKLVLGKLLEII